MSDEWKRPASPPPPLFLGKKERDLVKQFVREGDFVLYGETYYEMTKIEEPRKLFGQVGHTFEVVATCKRARKGLFDAT